MAEPFDERDECSRPDWHAVFSVQLGELIEDGVVDFNDTSWDYNCYSKEQRDRLYAKITNHYYWREIGVLPVKRWKMEVVRKLNELAPKYAFLYKALDDGVTPFQLSATYGKSRDITSDFPQTQLGANQDYASVGLDKEFENITDGNYIDIANNINTTYDDVDVMILKQLEPCFSCLLTVNMNAY